MKKINPSAVKNWRSRVIDPLASLLLIATLIHAWFLTFYYDKPYNFRLSWVAADGDVSWGKEFALGSHYFSDYTIVHFWSLESAPWIHLWNAYPPVAIFLVRIFGLFKPQGALFLWLVIGMIASLYPLIYVTYLRPLKEIIFCVGIFGIGSAGLIASFDRGNEILFLPPLIFFSYVVLLEQKDILAGLLLGLAISLKVYPIVLIPMLLLKRKFKTVLSSIISTLFLNLFAALVWGNPFEIFKTILTNTRNYGSTIMAGDPTFMSASSILVNAANALGVAQSSVVQFYEAHVMAFAGIGFLLILFACLRSSIAESFLFGLISMELIPLRSFTYTRIWTLIAIAILLAIESKQREGEIPLQDIEKDFNPRNLRIWWLIVVLFSAPLAVFLGNISITVGCGFLVFLVFLGIRIVENAKFYLSTYAGWRVSVKRV